MLSEAKETRGNVNFPPREKADSPAGKSVRIDFYL